MTGLRVCRTVVRSGYWGKPQPGQGVAIQGVRGFRLANVAGELVPKAGTIQWASNVLLFNISTTMAKNGFSCGQHQHFWSLEGHFNVVLLWMALGEGGIAGPGKWRITERHL